MGMESKSGNTRISETNKKNVGGKQVESVESMKTESAEQRTEKGSEER